MANSLNNRQQDEAGHRHDHGRHSGLKHMALMAACCLVPVAGAVVLSRLGYGSAAGFLMLLLCPLMHVFMMRVHGSKKEDGGNAELRRDGGG
jgi:hypothetical protein